MMKIITVMALAVLAQTGCGGGKATTAESADSAVMVTTADSNQLKKLANGDAKAADANATASESLKSVRHLCSSADSTEIESLLTKAKAAKPSNLMLFFARQLLGRPYVAHTLEVGDSEQLVINMKEMDCTTFTETCVALSICAARGYDDLAHYIDILRRLRYYDGEIRSYASRLHYFTEWIEENTKNGFVKEVQAPVPPFTATQTIDVHFMTRNPQYYKQLKAKPSLLKDIAVNESKINGKKYKYIPKSLIANTREMRQAVHDGDIIAILTSKDGLDTSHIGIAVWHADGLHLLNASSLKTRMKTVEEEMTFQKYMNMQKAHTGIRVIRLLENGAMNK